MRKGRATKAIVFLLCLLVVLPSHVSVIFAAEDSLPQHYYVSPNGSDDWSGTSADPDAGIAEGPFRTIAKAQQVVRQQIGAGMSGDITVSIRGGDYNLEEPLVFTEADSGRDGHVITYANYPGETPVINGGRVIEGWEAVPDKPYYKADVAGMTFNTLYEDGQRSVKARFPNAGYQHTSASVFNNNQVVNNQFMFAEGDIPEGTYDDLEIFLWPGGPDGEWNWHSNLRKAAQIDWNEHKVTLDRPAAYEIGAGSRYFVQNSLALLDEPGEFYLDAGEQDLYYYPRNADSLTNGSVVAPAMESIVKFKGSSESSPVSGIDLIGLTLRNTDLPDDTDTFGFETGLIHLENAEHIGIRNNQLYNSGLDGVYGIGWVQQNDISGNWIHDVGNSGIKLFGAWESLKYVSKQNTISNNKITRTGQMIGHGTGISLYESGDNEVTHNNITDTPRFSIELLSSRPGFTIGQERDGQTVTRENIRDYTDTQNNLVAFNDVSRANTDSQDTGVIYSYGSDTGNIIRNNWVHDSNVDFSFGYGIYLDDASDGFVVEDNVVTGLQREGGGKLNAPLMIKGVGTKVSNNIVADNNVQLSGLETFELGGEPNRNVDVERNIFYRSGDAVYRHISWTDDRMAASDYNLFYNAKGSYNMLEMPGVSNLDDWRRLQNNKFDTYSMTADPKFMNPEQGDYRLRYDSPAYGLGVHDINLEDIGLLPTFPYSDKNDTLDRIYIRGAGQAVNSGSLPLTAGSSESLVVTERTANGFIRTLGTGDVQFTAEDVEGSGAAVVSADGTVQAASPGAALITASYTKNGVTKTTAIYVVVGDTSDHLDVFVPKPVLEIGQTVKPQVKEVSAYGRITDATGSARYESLTGDIIAVDDAGIVTALKEGTGRLKVSVSDTVFAEVSIYVSSVVLKTVNVSMEHQMMFVGGEEPIAVSGVMSDDSEADLGEAEIAYSSSDESVLTVSDTGVVSAQAAGKADIQVSVTRDGTTLTKKLTIAVYPASGASADPDWTIKGFGDARYYFEKSGGQYTIATDGWDVYGPSDDFAYYYKAASPSASEALVVTLDVFSLVNTHNDASAGIMIRDSEEANANQVSFRILPGGGLRLVYRSNAYPESMWVNSFPTSGYPAKLKLVKAGNTFTAYYMKNGSWINAGSAVAEMDQSVLAGAAVFSRAELPTEAVISLPSVETQQLAFESVLLNASRTSIKAGETADLTVQGLLESGIAFDPQEYNAAIAFTSLTPDTATVDSASGVVTGLADGPAEFRVDVTLNGVTKSATKQITVIGRGHENLALGKPTAASSTVSWFNKDNPVDGVLFQDFSYNKIWASQLKTPGEWWQVDLGSRTDIGKVSLQYFAYKGSDVGGADPIAYYYVDVPKQLTIQVSDDGLSWTDVRSEKEALPQNLTLFSAELQSFDVSAKGRYIRLYFGEEGGAALSEVQVFESEAPLPNEGDDDGVPTGNEPGAGATQESEPEAASLLLKSSDLQPNGTDVLQLSLGDHTEEVVFPSSVLKLVQGKKLRIQRKDVVLSFEASVLKKLLELVPEQEAGSLSVSLQIHTIDKSTVQPAASDDTLIAGEIYEFELVARGSGNHEYRLEAFPAPVTVELAYSPTAAYEDLLGVYNYNERTKSWDYIGGAVDKQNNRITAALPHFSRYAVMVYKKSYADLNESHWAYEAVTVLSAKHIVNGGDGNRFEPSRSVTRAEFAAMLVRALQLKAGESTPFEDVAKDAWYASDVAAAYQAGLLQGRSRSLFAPQETITRQEMAVMLSRAAQRMGLSEPGQQTEKPEFADGARIAGWAEEAVRQVQRLGIIEGDQNGRFHPEEQSTRAETAQVLLRLMAKREAAIPGAE